MLRLHRFAVLLAATVLAAGVFAGEPDAAPPASGAGGPGTNGAAGGPQRGRGNRIQFMLKHADDLKLTEEQKTSLEALAKESGGAAPTPETIAAQRQKADAILDDAQREKVKELFKARQAERSDSSDLPPPPPPPPVVPHAEDKVKGAELLQFILGHKSEIFVRPDQIELLDPLAAQATKGAAGSEAEFKSKIFDILTGQQIGKLREMLKAQNATPSKN